MTLLRRVLGETLRGRRLRQQRTLREVSSTARVSLGYLSEVERGQKEASSELLAAICDALDIRLSDLLGEVSEAMRRTEHSAEVARVTSRPLVPAGATVRDATGAAVAGSAGPAGPRPGGPRPGPGGARPSRSRPGGAVPVVRRAESAVRGGDAATGLQLDELELDAVELDGAPVAGAEGRPDSERLGAELSGLETRLDLIGQGFDAVQLTELVPLLDLGDRPDGPHEARCQLAGAAA